MEATSPRSNACTTASQVTRQYAVSNDMLEAILRDLSVTFKCGRETPSEVFKIDIRTALKEMNKSFKTKVQDGFRNQGCARRRIHDELSNRKDDMHSRRMGGSCGSAASTEVCLGLDTFARLPFPGP